ncbi:CRISPR-associated protein Cas5 [filamentous cyanobacterium LEGE 11480]|uniref:CRISPR-associated protein Cas5 n=1 Tax=Romeriopsis navalis LEGE 11480 TaxID=2777977 RepID=A0A928Z0X2_9CYAN|nr:CRISPR-associated protein Cas5 [Romeriopsis navalis]MBE9028726.1 CRISPR-associated protein Cas5 [Romeriopsis navalis LEGE 11480]
MEYLWLRIRAPFAAFRAFQAGVYRSTSPIMPPSAAFGLVLNLASIEMRDSTPGVTTLIRQDLPCLNLAIGTPCYETESDEVIPVTESAVSTLYQQLHSYPVGASGKELKLRTHGAKYWITPVRREVLVGLDMILGVQAEQEILERVQLGLKGQLNESRYGLPFAGDNSFLFDQIDIMDEPPLTRWYLRMQPDDRPRRGSYRLTVGINRADNSKTSSFLYAPMENAVHSPPELAWTWTPRMPETVEVAQ